MEHIFQRDTHKRHKVEGKKQRDQGQIGADQHTAAGVDETAKGGIEQGAYTVAVVDLAKDNVFIKQDGDSGRQHSAVADVVVDLFVAHKQGKQ